ncbi:MAG: leucine-rich repeat protein, partial [Christensenellales bacterium]
MDKEGNLNGEFKEKLFTIDMVESCLVNGVLTIPKNINVLDTSIIKNLDDFGVKEIKFEKGSELTSVIGPINLEVDGDGIYLQKLEKVDFSNCQQLKSLDNCAFYKCHNLREVNFSNCANLEIVNHWIFACDRGLQKVDFSNCNKLKKFGESCFEGCKNLEFFDFNALESLEELGEFSFGQCMKFKNIDFANNRTIKIVGRGCFVCCYGAEKIDFSNSVIEKIGHNAFGYSNVK